MDQLVIQGVYRKNTRGRAYLIYRDREGIVRGVRCSCKLDIPGGREITAVGVFRDGWFLIDRVVENIPPRRVA